MLESMQATPPSLTKQSSSFVASMFYESQNKNGKLTPLMTKNLSKLVEQPHMVTSFNANQD